MVSELGPHTQDSRRPPTVLAPLELVLSGLSDQRRPVHRWPQHRRRRVRVVRFRRPRWEHAREQLLDRIGSAASLRPVQRQPAGTILPPGLRGAHAEQHLRCGQVLQVVNRSVHAGQLPPHDRHLQRRAEMRPLRINPASGCVQPAPCRGLGLLFQQLHVSLLLAELPPRNRLALLRPQLQQLALRLLQRPDRGGIRGPALRLCTRSYTRNIHKRPVHFQSLDRKWSCLFMIVSRTAAFTGEVPARLQQRAAIGVASRQVVLERTLASFLATSRNPSACSAMCSRRPCSHARHSRLSRSGQEMLSSICTLRDPTAWVSKKSTYLPSGICSSSCCSFPVHARPAA